MKILELNERERSLKIRVDNEDDLWELYNVLYKDDLIIGKTTREVKTQTSSWRRPVTLTLKVEWAEMQPMTSRLRIHGIVVDCPEDLEARGKHHTINLEPGSVVVLIKKESWNDLDIKRLREAEKRVSVNAIIASLDNEDLCVARLTSSGFQVVFEEKVELRTKNKELPESFENKQIEKIAGSIKKVVEDLKPNVLAISGPSIYLEKLSKALEGLTSVKMIKVETSYGGIAGVREAIKKEALRDAIRESEIIKEQELMEKFMEMVSRDLPVAYGLNFVEEAAQRGAVETLLIDKDVLNDPTTRERVVNIVEKVISTRGAVKVFTSNQEARFWLKDIGGIAAILRFKVEYSQ